MSWVAAAMSFAFWLGATAPGQLWNAAEIAVACQARGVDPLVGVSVAWQESRFVSTALGGVGEIGTMQIYWHGSGHAFPRDVDLWDTWNNAQEGCARLAFWKHHKRAAVRRHYIAHYNGGWDLKGKTKAFRYERAVKNRIVRWRRATLGET